MTRIVPSIRRVVPWVEQRLEATMHADEAIGLERDGEIVAGVVYENWNGASFVCHIAVEGLLTPAYLAAIFHYPFVHCAARKILVPVAESNEKSLRFVGKLGFRLEHRILDAHPDGAILLYGMTPDSCRFIGEKYGQKIAIPAASA
jgi:RimJ/RimL family protein N-acetyltransferase